MEGAKNSMYMQAGRNRGWSVVNPVYADDATYSPEPVVIAEPPVVIAPEVVIAPPATKPQNNCQTAAMAYVEMQKWQELYEPEQGFSRGTIFTQLDLPFVGEGACHHE